MKATGWRQILERLVDQTDSGALSWSRGDQRGAAVAANARGSFVIRYEVAVGFQPRPRLEVRDADGRVVDVLEAPSPLAAIGNIYNKTQDLLPEPTPADILTLIPMLDALVASVRASGDRAEDLAMGILDEVDE